MKRRRHDHRPVGRWLANLARRPGRRDPDGPVRPRHGGRAGHERRGSAAGAAVAAKEASFRLSLPEAGIEPSRSPSGMPQPGVYFAQGILLPRGGRWRVRLELLVDDFTKLILEGELDLPAADGHDHSHHAE